MMWWILFGIVFYLLVMFFAYALVQAAGRNRDEFLEREAEMQALRKHRLTGRW